MAGKFRLRRPRSNQVVEVTTSGRRDALISRGYTPVEDAPEAPKPQSGQKRRTKPKSV